jgi:hypothetical protein
MRLLNCFNRRPPARLVYIVSSREEFAQWVGSHPGNFRYANIHSADCVRGLVHLHPPAKFVVLPSANFSALLHLHSNGFPVDNPMPKETEREKQIRHWQRKLARFGDLRFPPQFDDV